MPKWKNTSGRRLHNAQCADLFKALVRVCVVVDYVYFFMVGFSFFTVLTDPGIVGRMAGEVVSGYNESVK